jgi:hypothetical protein
MSSTAYALTGFVAWALFLLVLMEAIRLYLVIAKKVAANGFTPDNAGLSPFMQRLARAHTNCIEGLPISVAVSHCNHDIKNGKYRLFGILVSWGADPAVSYPSRFDQFNGGKPSLRCLRGADDNRCLLVLEATLINR